MGATPATACSSAAFHWEQHAETVEMLHPTDGVPERRVAERGCERISGSGYLGSVSEVSPDVIGMYKNHQRWWVRAAMM